jgi:type IV fimbrial biogenesis protein FimT
MVASFAVPAFGHWRMRDRVEARAGALVGALSLARSEAIRRGMRVTVCRSDGAGRCALSDTRCAAGPRDWSCGWLVFADRPGDVAPVLLRVDGPQRQIRIVSTLRSVTFTPPVGGAASSAGNFALGADGAPPGARGDIMSRCVRIAFGGRVRANTGACAEMIDGPAANQGMEAVGREAVFRPNWTEAPGSPL